MEGLIEKLMPIAFSVVMGLVATHPRTWRVELAKLQYSILKEATRTDNWGDPSIGFHQNRSHHLKTNYDILVLGYFEKSSFNVFLAN